MSYIITARMDAGSSQTLDQLRRKYFPAERNFIPAHLTLCHQAPEELPVEAPPPSFPLRIRFQDAYFSGFGFAVRAECGELLLWKQEFLKTELIYTSQDRQKKSLHVTIQNKVDPEKAKSDFEVFRKEWVSFEGQVNGIDLWRYRGGPWEYVRSLI